MSTFLENLDAACESRRSLLCVGLDPDPERMAVKDVFQFNRSIIDATSDLVCAYKPNMAFYEALGLEGLRALEKTIAHARQHAPGVLIIGDAKRGDVGNTAKAYASALFGVWGFDAVTVNAYGGQDSIQPFLEYDDRGTFLWCRSSNPGARDLQDLQVGTEGHAEPVYRRLAASAAGWNVGGNLGLVVGATYPEELKAVRELCPDMPLLIPGVGPQGGGLEDAVSLGTDKSGKRAIINSSRQVLYASSGSDFAEAARREAVGLRDRINGALDGKGLGWS